MILTSFLIRFCYYKEALWSSGQSSSAIVQKVAISHEFRGSALPCGDWKTLSVNPAVNGYLFRIREGKVAKGEGAAPLFISCA